MTFQFLPLRVAALLLAAPAVLQAVAMPGMAAAQIRTVDPSSPEVAAAARGGAAPAPDISALGPAPDDMGDPVPAAEADGPAARPRRATDDTRPRRATGDTRPRRATDAARPLPATPPASTDPVAAGEARTGLPTDSTFKDEEVFGAAERVFGKGAQGLAKIVEDVLKKQGRPTAYIAGREAGGAIAIGLRYGQGDLFHKVEGSQPVHWTGPSLGFDIGANGAKTFILVYNLYDSEDLFKRFPLVEGNLYAVGGFTASYLRRGDVVLVPIRLGVGWRFGASVGYMRFSKKGRVLPF